MSRCAEVHLDAFRLRLPGVHVPPRASQSPLPSFRGPIGQSVPLSKHTNPLRSPICRKESTRIEVLERNEMWPSSPTSASTSTPEPGAVAVRILSDMVLFKKESLIIHNVHGDLSVSHAC